MPDVTIAQAIWRDVTIQNAMNVQNAIVNHPDTVHQITNSGDALIARSRSILATKFLDEIPESDVLVFVDGDITFEPDAFAKVVAGARETQDIYGGLYVTRSRDPHLASLPFAAQEWRFQQTPERRPLEVRYLATGFMAIPRVVLERMAAADWFQDLDGGHQLHRYEKGTNGDRPYDFFRTFGIEDDGANHWLSEDWAFCERWRQLGGKVWADQAVILGHQAGITLTVEDLAQGEAIEETSGLEHYTVAKTPQHPLIESLPADIAAWNGETEEHVRAQLPHAATLLATLWDDPDDVQAWYARKDVGRAYVYDLAHWHMNGAAQHFYDRLDPVIEDITLDGALRILDFGAGIGTLALMLAQDGHDVSVYEPNEVMRQFMAARSETHGLSRGLMHYPGAPYMFEPRSFDLIVATHVFEHLLPDATKTALEAIAECLTDDGLLFYDNDFHVDEGHPQHYEHEDTFYALLADAGFDDLGNGWARKTAQQPARGREPEEVASGLV